jgi:hypothetical protein
VNGSIVSILPNYFGRGTIDGYSGDIQTHDALNLIQEVVSTFVPKNGGVKLAYADAIYSTLPGGSTADNSGDLSPSLSHLSPFSSLV